MKYLLEKLVKHVKILKMCVCVLSRVQLFMTSWTVAHQTSLSMEFSRQEYQSGLPFLTPGYSSDPGIEPKSLLYPALRQILHC